jgi:UDP-N-acetylmuramyl pentapeptide synthase
MDASAVRACAGAEEASEVLDDLLAPGDAVLVKASRSMGLEQVVEGIVHPRA